MLLLPAMELDATDKTVPQPSTVTATHPDTELDATDNSVPQTWLVQFLLFYRRGGCMSALLNSLDFLI